MTELNYIVRGRGFDICKDPSEDGEEWYTYYSGLITFTLHREDMIDFIRSVTDPDNQRRMMEELDRLRHVRQDLVDRVFEIQVQIDQCDRDNRYSRSSGIMVPDGPEKVVWRDNDWFQEDGKKQYSFSFSTDGQYRGDLPPDCSSEIIRILRGYKESSTGKGVIDGTSISKN